MATVPPPRPVFIYGSLRALPLLAWVLTGDYSNINAVAKFTHPARVNGYARFALHRCDYLATIKHESSEVDGLLVRVETKSQRQKVHDFEGEIYKAMPVNVILEGRTTVDADMYVWNGDAEKVSDKPWELQDFINERLEDWLDLFDGIELVGDDDEMLADG
ncbi:hypothetical protein FVEN_g2289 [Fusarium venenatum]|uniref:Putative gamma-glutamylcyclotransferase n=1 Tax=Fusarium venenatum TaxID=56646 RepID=A0A2L2T1V2_9HYPO|nr:uncharacterized protein FVRRES_12724 [Fusarium venenatum]KAG8360277.1 hypothetical protein FVEN_g2289 [Fusarium venenatum]KAH6979317.1 hypothetical protein EDB82DRAFT_507540 [Fusarium venenatum]CEI40033.1 unnamed protein product [Fusarium venenatum]